MKSIRVMLFCALTLLSTASVTRAQIVDTKRFTVPFMFEAGNHLMPAGTYRLIPVTGRTDMYTLSDVNSTTNVLITAGGFDKTAPRLLEDDKVVFVRDEDHYVMTQVWDAAYGSAIQLSGTFELTKAAEEREGATPDVKVLVHMDRVNR